MKIEQYDSNLKLETNISKPGLTWFDIRKAPFTIYGLDNPCDSSLPFHRMPLEAAEKVSSGVKDLNYHTAGGRVRFATNSEYIAIKCETQVPIGYSYMRHMAFSGSQGFDMYIENDIGTFDFQAAFIPSCQFEQYSFEAVADTPDDKVHEYIINFPLYGFCKNLYIGISENSVLNVAKPYVNKNPIVFYGSSITQGGCASRPGSSYQNFISCKYNVDYINLGFSGNAKGEDSMIEYIASLDMCMFVSDYDHNAPSLEHLQATLPKLYEAVRKAHPSIPYLFISSPGMKKGKMRRDFIYDTYKKAKESCDKNVYFVDGATMFEGEFSHSCTVDGCHPTDLGFFRMFTAIDNVLKNIL